jgi:glycosyltransferase involved in cell wall biosynthesis
MNGVSIVICCYNSAKRITPTLEYLQKVNAHGIPWEVILVDNCSEDETILISLSVWEENPVTTLRIVSEKNKGLMHARLAGVRNTKYDIISFIDDDNWVEPEWVSKVSRIMNNDETIAACGGSSQPVFEINPPDWFSEFSADFAVGRQQKNDGFVNPEKDPAKRYLWGAGITVRKDAWNDLFENGFTSLLKGRTGKSLTAGEDSEICSVWVLRGWNLWYEDSLRLKHYMPAFRLDESYLAAIYSGFGKAEVILSQYKGFIHPHLMNKNSWHMQCLVAFRNMTIAGIKNLFSTKENKIKNKICWNHERAYAEELILNRDKFYMVKELIAENTSKQTKPQQNRREMVA